MFALSVALTAPSPATVQVLIVVLCLIWGSTWIVIKEGLEDLPPLWSAGARFVVAWLVLVLVAPWLHRREGGGRPPTWLWIAFGVTNFAISYGIVYLTESILPSGLVSVLWSVFPLMMAAAGHWFLPGEQIGVRQALGFVVGFGGIVLLFQNDLQEFGADAIPAALLLFLSPLSVTIGTTLVKRYAGNHTSSVLLNRNAIGVGGLCLVGCALLFERDAELTLTPTAVWSVLYLAVMGTCVTFTLYYWLLRFARANRLSLIAFVTPCIALLLGAVFGGEAVTAWTLAGSALVVSGVALVVS